MSSLELMEDMTLEDMGSGGGPNEASLGLANAFKDYHIANDLGANATLRRWLSVTYL
jgi:hypothetical protein